MTESYSYIKNARLIDSSLSSAKYADILIQNTENGARIVQMGKVLLPKGAKIAVTDAKGAFACPGFVDLRAHLCATGSKPDAPAVREAARVGGYSRVLTCPDGASAQSLTSSINRSGDVQLMTLSDLCASKSCADISELGAMGFYDEGALNSKLLRDAMRLCAQNDHTLFVKCQDASLSGGVMNEGERAKQMKMSGTPALCEELALARYLMLAKDTGCKIHVHTISTKGSVEMIREAKKSGIKVTCDTCPQYFSLTDDQILFKGSAAKVDPPLRSLDDAAAIIEGLADGMIDAISTDHTPCDKVLKRRPLEDAPFGMIMLESAFLIGVTNLVEKGYLSIYRLIDAMCFAPMRILGIEYKNASGINLFSLTDETYASKAMFVGGYSNSAFEGWHFSGKLIKIFSCEW